MSFTVVVLVLVASCLASLANVSGLEIVSRAQWGARSPKSRTWMRTPVSMVFIHHTVSGRCYTKTDCIARMKSIQNYHMDSKGWADIGYSFLVGDDGRVYEGRGWTTVGAHTSGYNSKSIGISYHGNFMTVLPTAAALKAGKDLIASGISKGYLKSSLELFGHRNVKATDCPGTMLYNDLKNWPHWEDGVVG